MKQKTPDAALIKALGGPTKVAELIGIEKRGGAQRVQNWMVRGIPASAKVQYPHIFMPELAAAQSHQAQAATHDVAMGVANV